MGLSALKEPMYTLHTWNSNDHNVDDTTQIRGYDGGGGAGGPGPPQNQGGWQGAWNPAVHCEGDVAYMLTEIPATMSSSYLAAVLQTPCKFKADDNKVHVLADQICTLGHYEAEQDECTQCVMGKGICVAALHTLSLTFCKRRHESAAWCKCFCRCLGTTASLPSGPWCTLNRYGTVQGADPHVTYQTPW